MTSRKHPVRRNRRQIADRYADRRTNTYTDTEANGYTDTGTDRHAVAGTKSVLYNYMAE